MSKIGKQRGQNGRFVVLSLSILVILFSVYHLVTRVDWCLLQEIEISGLHYLTKQEVLQTLDLRIGTDSLHTITQESVARRLTQNLIYVSDVKVSKRLLRGILHVQIAERKPSVMLVHATQQVREGRAPADETSRSRISTPLPLIEDLHAEFRLADLEGVVLQAVENPMEYARQFPIVVSFSEGAVEPGNRLTSESTSYGLETIRLVRERVPELEAAILGVYPDDPHKIQIKLKDSAPGWLAAEDIEEGLRNLSTVLRHSREALKEADYIDTRFRGMVYCGGLDRIIQGSGV